MGNRLVRRGRRLVFLLRRLRRSCQGRVRAWHVLETGTSRRAHRDGQGFARGGGEVGGRARWASTGGVDETGHGDAGFRREKVQASILAASSFRVAGPRRA